MTGLIASIISKKRCWTTSIKLITLISLRNNHGDVCWGEKGEKLNRINNVQLCDNILSLWLASLSLRSSSKRLQVSVREIENVPKVGSTLTDSFQRERSLFHNIEIEYRFCHLIRERALATYCKVVTVVCRWWEIKCEFSSWETPLTRVKIERSFTDATALISGLSMSPSLARPPATSIADNIQHREKDDVDDIKANTQQQQHELDVFYAWMTFWLNYFSW